MLMPYVPVPPRKIDLLNQTQAMARIVGWTMDLDTRASSWTEQAPQMFGTEGPELRELLARGDFLAPDDREVFRAALAEAEVLGEPFDLELRRAKNGGPQAWVRIMGRRTCAGNALLIDRSSGRLLSSGRLGRNPPGGGLRRSPRRAVKPPARTLRPWSEIACASFPCE